MNVFIYNRIYAYNRTYILHGYRHAYTTIHIYVGNWRSKSLTANDSSGHAFSMYTAIAYTTPHIYSRSSNSAQSIVKGIKVTASAAKSSKENYNAIAFTATRNLDQKA